MANTYLSLSLLENGAWGTFLGVNSLSEEQLWGAGNSVDKTGVSQERQEGEFKGLYHSFYNKHSLLRRLQRGCFKPLHVLIVHLEEGRENFYASFCLSLVRVVNSPALLGLPPRPSSSHLGSQSSGTQEGSIYDICHNTQAKPGMEAKQ